jgi:succinate dehydrogenase/fumarate reductase flavoprotein subunit
LVIAGAGMAGLVAAARARQLGGRPVVLEKGERLGGSMLLSSGVAWRYRSLEEFRAQCPGGDPVLQQLIIERLDDALDWLETLGAPAVERETGNPLTVGRRFDTRRLTETLGREAGEVTLGAGLPDDEDRRPLVLATGGFAARLARETHRPLRASPWSEGDALEYARRRGAALSGGLDEFYGRAMPDVPFEEQDFVRLAQVYGKHALAILDEGGQEFFAGPVSWSENDLVQAISRLSGGTAWFVLDDVGLAKRVRERTVAQIVEAAREAGGTVVPAAELPFAVPAGAVVAVRVRAAVTHTIGGVVVDKHARVLREKGTPIDGLYAAGVDAGGWSTGGYASGLAAALVLGLVAASSARG